MVAGTVESFQPDRLFDLVSIFHVLEHVRQPQLALAKMSSWLKDDGWLVVEVPNIESYLAKTSRFELEVYGVGALVLFFARDLGWLAGG